MESESAAVFLKSFKKAADFLKKVLAFFFNQG
jgi:hypothetical protein